MFGNGSENGAENGAQNGWILRGLALKNRAPVCMGCVLSKIDASRNESRKWTKMETKMSSKIDPNGLIWRSWGRLSTFWRVLEKVVFWLILDRRKVRTKIDGC